MTTMNGTARADVLRGTDRTDWINGGDGDDRIDGLGGNDLLFGGAGRDTLNGGSGSDYVDGGAGDDLLVYSMGENRGAYDIYNGGFGRDTLRLQFTAAEWDRADVRQDVHRFLAFLPEYNEPLGWTDDPVFAFRTFGLALVGVNKLEVFVDGRAIDARDRAVTAAADALTLSEDAAAGATVNLLANDLAPDGFRSVRIAQPANGRVELVSTDFAAANPSATIRFTPGDAYQSLAAGQTAVEVFTYTVVDKDGDEKTANVRVTITGTNDAPVAVADAATGSEDEYVIEGSVAANDRDVDAGDELTYEFTGYSFGFSFSMEPDGGYRYSIVNAGHDDLAAGETRTVTLPYSVTDKSGAVSHSTLTITITGENDAHTWGGNQFTFSADSADTRVEGDRFVQEAFIFGADFDSRGGSSVSVAPTPADYLGELTLFDDGYGNLSYRFEIDQAIVRALGEGATVYQDYVVSVDDGQGAVSTETLTIVIEGDGNDPIYPGDVQLIDRTTDGDVRSDTLRFFFQDPDLADAHGVVATPDADGFIGSFAVGEVVKTDDYGRRYVDVTYSYSLSAAEALPEELQEQGFSVTISDGNGDAWTVERRLPIAFNPRPAWDVGGDGNDDLGPYEGRGNILVGAGGDDRLQGGEWGDRLFGDAGPALPDGVENRNAGARWDAPVAGFNDQLDGGAGADTLTGGEGADRFRFSRGEADGDEITDFSAADGDRIELRGWEAGATVTRLDDTQWLIADADGWGGEVITLSNGAELTADDFVFEQRDVAWSVGGEGDDLLSAPEGEARHVLVGGAGRDKLLGDAHADELYGDEGPALPADEANGWDRRGHASDGRYDDELNGGGGADLLVGGAGGDLFVFGRGQTDGDVVRDFDGASGDRLDLTDFGLGATLTRLDDTRWEVSDEYGFNVEVITLANGADLAAGDVLFAEPDTEWWIGGDGDDELATPGGDVRYVLVGGVGRDDLLGDEFDDELYGDEGPALPADEENGWDGEEHSPDDDGFDDRLDGYGGADLLVGGAGADLFTFGEGQADGDVVRDFDGASGDRLDFTDFGWGATFTQLDATRWEIVDADRETVEVITFTNAPTITPDYLIMG